MKHEYKFIGPAALFGEDLPKLEKSNPCPWPKKSIVSLIREEEAADWELVQIMMTDGLMIQTSAIAVEGKPAFDQVRGGRALMRKIDPSSAVLRRVDDKP